MYEVFLSCIKKKAKKKVTNSPVKPPGDVEMRAYRQRLIQNYTKIAKSAGRPVPGKPPWKPSSLSAELNGVLGKSKESFRKASQKCLHQAPQLAKLPFKFINPK